VFHLPGVWYNISSGTALADQHHRTALRLANLASLGED